jgi:hypothetical protein
LKFENIFLCDEIAETQITFPAMQSLIKESRTV